MIYRVRDGATLQVGALYQDALAADVLDDHARDLDRAQRVIAIREA